VQTAQKKVEQAQIAVETVKANLAHTKTVLS